MSYVDTEGKKKEKSFSSNKDELSLLWQKQGK
jgi:hypothetical protein